MNKTGLLFFPAFDWSLGETHPEREERLLYTQEQIFEEGVMDLPQINQYAPGLASLTDALRAQALFPSAKAHDLDAHLVAAGSALVLGETWAKGEISNGFALVRPPGHHSGATVWGNRGFCTLNNEAILVNYLRAKYNLKKIAIVDTDVHHGDGTQDIFFHDPNVLFISLHQDGRTLYPGSGFINEKGGPNAWEKTLNIPLPPGTGDEGFHHILESWVLPELEAFKPDIIINSAGQDNHFTDPLASMNVTARGYGRITELLKPDLAVLEGGYSIEDALPYVNLAILLSLAGEDYREVVEPQKPRRATVNQGALKTYVEELKKQYKNTKIPWAAREEAFLPSGKWFYFPHSVYYDTEGFQEHRRDWVRQCHNCGGTVYIETQRDLLNHKGTLVRIPFDACPECTQAGYDLWDQLTRKMQNAILQDQPQDRIHIWDCHEGVKHF